MIFTQFVLCKHSVFNLKYRRDHTSFIIVKKMLSKRS
jgi:hypothetical protein